MSSFQWYQNKYHPLSMTSLWRHKVSTPEKLRNCYFVCKIRQKLIFTLKIMETCDWWFFSNYVRKWQFQLANKASTAYHFKYFQTTKFWKYRIAPTPLTSRLWKLTLPFGIGGRFDFFSKMKRKDKLWDIRSNCTPLLRILEHLGENCYSSES